MSEPATSDKHISKSVFAALVKKKGEIRTEVAELNGELGERLKHHQESSNLHLKAFGVVCQMDKMDELKRNGFRGALSLYLDFADEVLWGGVHVGDLVDDAQKAEAEEQAAVDDQMAKNGDLLSAGIKELPVDAPDGKPKRGRPAKAKASSEPVVVEHDALQPYRQRGAAAYKIGKPGIIPADLEGKKAQAEAYLEGWSAEAKRSADKHDAEARGKVFEDDAESDAPSVRQNEKREALPGADAPGSYAVTH